MMTGQTMHGETRDQATTTTVDQMIENTLDTIKKVTAADELPAPGTRGGYPRPTPFNSKRRRLLRR